MVKSCTLGAGYTVALRYQSSLRTSKTKSSHAVKISITNLNDNSRITLNELVVDRATLDGGSSSFSAVVSMGRLTPVVGSSFTSCVTSTAVSSQVPVSVVAIVPAATTDDRLFLATDNFIHHIYRGALQQGSKIRSESW